MKQEGGQPMTRNNVIDSANSIITGSNIPTAMNHFHQSNSTAPKIKFGPTWYRKFARRKKHHLENRRGERQHQVRKYWTTHEKIITMYGRVYAAIVDAKLATPLD